MEDCKSLNAYLDGQLPHDAQTAFVSHAAVCPRCGDAVARWQQAAGQMIDFDRQSTEPRVTAPGEADVTWLVQKATHLQNRKQPNIRSRIFSRRLWALAAAMLLCIGGLGYLLIASRDSTPPAGAAATSTAPAAPTRGFPGAQLAETSPFDPLNRSVAPRDTITAGPERGRCFSVAPDDVCLTAGSAVSVNVTPASHRFVMAPGTMLFRVTPGEARSVEVLAGKALVRVVGTRFMVSMSEDESVSVVVQKGVVQVTFGAEEVRLTMGEAADVSSAKMSISRRAPTGAEFGVFERAASLLNAHENAAEPVTETAASHRPRATNTGMELDDWRKKMLAGETDDALAGLRAHLRTHPEDAEASFLLATCYKKKAQFSDALSVYSDLEQRGPKGVASRALYLAGDVCLHQLNDPAQAVRHFTAFLDRSAPDVPNRAEALYYKAEALLLLGQSAESRLLFTQIVNTYGRLPIAQRAKKRLEQTAP